MEVSSFVDQHDYGFVVPPCSRRDLINQAHLIHKSIGYTGEGPFPIMHLVEELFYALYEDYTFEVIEPSCMDDSLGLTLPNEHTIKIREDVYDAAYEGQGFARMVVGHESSHLIRHENTPISMAFLKADRNLPAYRSSEWQANALAGALLMPADKIINMSIDEIVYTYKVSRDAAKTQLKAIKKEATEWELPII